MHEVRCLADVAGDEFTERRESGYAVETLRPALEAALADGSDVALEDVLLRLSHAPRAPEWPYREPTDLAEILDTLPAPAAVSLDADPGDELGDRIHAAWLGRCAGCMLGKPLEGCSLEEARTYLRSVNAYPLLDYVPASDSLPEGVLHPSWPKATRDRIDGVARDDDIDYSILELVVLEQHGFGYTTEDAAHELLARLPFEQVYTAERAAYRNLVLGRPAAEASTYRNPWREFIGAQIRADVFGYVSPGDPLGAARLVHPDAVLSHVANGVYGAMWIAALLAAAFTAESAVDALCQAATVVPPESRLSAALRFVDSLHERGFDWDEARNAIEDRLGELSWVHVLSNAALVAAALRYGEGDFARSVGLAVQGGWDTDCNGATVGSVFGALHGRAAIPPRFADPLADRVRTAIFDEHDPTISELAARTTALARLRLQERLNDGSQEHGV